jgi:hypothetical protein
VLLLVLFGVALVSGSAMILWSIRYKKGAARRGAALRTQEVIHPSPAHFYPAHAAYIPRPTAWLSVRSRNLRTVQSALGLLHPKPCSWTDGLCGEEKLFIAPPVGGWILVIGSRLPDPGDDVDICYRFLVDVSRKLGHVQFFTAVRPLGHHAWVRLEGGRVVRAYVWAGSTLWNQGARTRAERELGLKCFQYLENPERTLFGPADVITTNTERVPLLAARWSFDPGAVDERIVEQISGVSGEPSRLY